MSADTWQWIAIGVLFVLVILLHLTSPIVSPRERFRR